MTYWGTNTYLLDWPGGVAVLDPGPDDPSHVASVLGAAGAPVRAILLTHTHHDHVGAAPALRAATGAPLYAWHDPADPALVPDVKLHDGERAGEWQAVFTPGHAADHLAFAGPEGVVFSGDHVMGWSTTVVGPPGGNMADYFASLDVLLARPGLGLFAGPWAAAGRAARLRRSRCSTHRRAREASILDALDCRAAIGARPRRAALPRCQPGAPPRGRAQRDGAPAEAEGRGPGAGDLEQGWRRR